jgi:hypothetical protein
MVWQYIPQRSSCKSGKASAVKIGPDVGAETCHVVDYGDNDYFYWILNNFIFGFCVYIFIKNGSVTIMQMNTRLYENLFP